MGLFTLGDDDKMQYDDVVMHWVLYPFHNDVYFVDVVVA